ncbi:hypothetical protein [Paenibacillus sp. N3.4]|uniref:hypothetical protein n=1 Tax=Paenibacillus sp. N3.4 TaxID=2603222 RepID=UPI00164F5CD0|nr:hypothetical protein [Paenibacillus sp. N3.4]
MTLFKLFMTLTEDDIRSTIGQKSVVERLFIIAHYFARVTHPLHLQYDVSRNLKR